MDNGLVSKMLLVDLNGTVRKSTNGLYITEAEGQELLPNRFEVLQRFKQDGWKVIGVTNHKDIMAGYKTFAGAVAEENYFLGICQPVDYVLFCPDDGERLVQVTRDNIIHHIDPKGRKVFRKPQNGMLEWAQKNHGFPRVVLYVGDRSCDYGAAKQSNISFVFADPFFELPFHELPPTKKPEETTGFQVMTIRGYNITVEQ